MKFGIVVFPGSWSERDMHYAVADVLGYPAEYVWHRETTVKGFDAILLPGGFSYGDYLRCGAIAAHSPVMGAIKDYADGGGYVFGSCNGFQILCESGLLPGALIRNDHLEFRCSPGKLRVENSSTAFTSQYEDRDLVSMPISHGEGNFQADDTTLAMLERDGRVLFRYVDEDNEATEEANPNGSLNNIAGITNERGNVLGMMPHPERACESILGSIDGNPLWRSIASTVDGAGK